MDAARPVGDGDLERAAAGQAIFRHPRLLAWGLFTAALSWVAQIVGIHWALHAYGIDTGIGVAGLVFLASTLVGLFPIVPGNIVVFQGATVAALTFATNVSAEQAFTFSIGLQLIEALLSVGLGFFFLSYEGLSLGELRTRGRGVGQGQRAVVERPADDDAVGAGPRPRAATSDADPMPPAAISSPGTARPQPTPAARVSGPRPVPSRSIAVTRKSRTPDCGQPLDERDRAAAGVLQPAGRAHGAVADVGGDGHAGRLHRRAGRPGSARSAASVPISTRATPSSSASATSASLRTPPPTWTASPDSRDEPADQVRRARPAAAVARGGRGRSRAAASRPPARSDSASLQRIDVVGGDRVVAALAQAHDPPVEQIDGRNGDRRSVLPC